MDILDNTGVARVANIANTRADALTSGMANIVTALDNITSTSADLQKEISDRKAADTTIQNSINETLTNTNKLIESANSAIVDANGAIAQAKNVNAVLDNDILTVTDRDNNSKSIQLLSNYENVTVNLFTTKSNIDIVGTQLNVYINNDTTTPIQYNADSNGVVTFRIAKGNYYKIVFPDKAGCAHIAPIGYTACIDKRTITVEYKDTVSGVEEIHVFTRLFSTASTNVAIAAGYQCTLTMDGATTTFKTNENGEYVFKAEYGKELTITASDQNDKKVVSDVPIKHTANAAIKYIYVYFSDALLGVTILDKNLNTYTAKEWSAAGKSKQDAFLIRIASTTSYNHGADIYIDAQAIANKAYTSKLPWQSTNSNLLLDCPSTVDTWNGMQQCDNYIAQAKSNGVTVPAIDKSMSYSLTDNNGGVWKGYLGSKEQWELTWVNINELDAALTVVFGDGVTMSGNYSDSKWTSTQFSSNRAWYFGTGSDYNPKGGSGYVVPFFLLSINN